MKLARKLKNCNNITHDDKTIHYNYHYIYTATTATLQVINWVAKAVVLLGPGSRFRFLKLVQSKTGARSENQFIIYIYIINS